MADIARKPPPDKAAARPGDRMMAALGMTELSAAQRLILAFIAFHEGEAGAWPAAQTMADHLGIKRSTVFWHLQNLEAKGALQRIKSPKGKDVKAVAYRVNSQATPDYVPDSQAGPDDVQLQTVRPDQNRQSGHASADSQAGPDTNHKEPDKEPDSSPPPPSPQPPALPEQDEERMTSSQILERWNKAADEFGLPHVNIPTPQLLAAIEGRVADHGVNGVVAAIKGACASEFCTGGGPNGWRASLEWLMQPQNLVKAANGGFDRKRADRSNIEELVKEMATAATDSGVDGMQTFSDSEPAVSSEVWRQSYREVGYSDEQIREAEALCEKGRFDKMNAALRHVANDSEGKEAEQ